MDEHQAITVTQLNKYLKHRIESDDKLQGVWVKGEISNFTDHIRTGHLYMSLKDDGGVLKAIMFASYKAKLAFKPEDGMKVICKGRIAVYEQGGVYQLYIEEMIPDGVGALYIAYEQLKNKLEKEGLFDVSHKMRIPKIPYRVGVITSPTGAAIRDIINIITRRFPLAEIILYPVLVQGENAASSLTEAVRYFNETKSVNVIIIGRGGGSIEDLWAFNDETLARIIYDCSIPIISAVGHETDFTICDFVSDLRAPTPSAAAELCVPDSAELLQKFANLKNTVFFYTRKAVKEKENRLKAAMAHTVFKNPMGMIDNKKIQLFSISEKTDMYYKITIQKIKGRFAQVVSKLEALSPLAVLARGYSYAEKNGKIISSVKDIKTEDEIKITFSDGFASAVVKEIR